MKSYATIEISNACGPTSSRLHPFARGEHDDFRPEWISGQDLYAWQAWPLRATIGGEVLSMSGIAIEDSAIEIEASIVAQGLELEPSAPMRKRRITSLSEPGVNDVFASSSTVLEPSSSGQ